ncbi:hypothetical protein NRIC_18090 [Enterococcus florum]|uniref:Polysaccharide biosynthesis protein n=1 Tax=Enterococcus florum TaxID=2480627 RepID=A0A4P5PD30_9ENTE|nr:oligosaccharide flippase family protein [Enterococcus florum]GCF93918.1 hypothetical protein NRIC_18090 [Enterococcus florum]
MKKYYNELLEKAPNSKKNSLWYSIGMFTFSFSSILLLLVVTRMLGTSEAGIFSIGWAVCQQMLTIGMFGTRNYQVADLNEKYNFNYYFYSKFCSVMIMLVGSFVYGKLLHLDGYKMLIAFLLTLLMSGEAFADVFAGFFQQHERLEISGKSYFVRILCYDILFIGALYFSNNLALAIIFAIFFSYIWLFFVDFQVIRHLRKELNKPKSKRMLQLFIECAPIFLSAFLTNYIINIPKNSIELLLTNEIQSVYNVLFMPSAIITLFTSFVLVPMYTTISKAWSINDRKGYFSIVKKVTFTVLGLTILVVFGGYFIGIPVLSLVYSIDLFPYKNEFILLLVAGGLNSFANVLVYLLIVAGKQKYLLYVYGIAAILATIISTILVSKFGIFGAASLYCISISFVVISLLVILFSLLYKQKKFRE